MSVKIQKFKGQKLKKYHIFVDLSQYLIIKYTRPDITKKEIKKLYNDYVKVCLKYSSWFLKEIKKLKKLHKKHGKLILFYRYSKYQTNIIKKLIEGENVAKHKNRK